MFAMFLHALMPLVAVAGGIAGGNSVAIGPAMAVVAAGPLLLALLIALAFPETARRELEDLNPEDRGVP